jgi:RND family efflux transporter MFP subunit
MSDTRPPDAAKSAPKKANHDHDSGELEFELPEAARPSSTRVIALLAGGVAVVVAAFVVGYLPRHKHKTELVTETKEETGANLKVQVFAPKAKSSDRAMLLPGSVQPLEEAVIYPRANGYIKSWKVDIGDNVKEGQLLAEIDTPEIDQQYAQAKAQLAQSEAALVQAKANKGYSQTTLQRLNTLAPKGVTSQQELEKAQAQSVVDDSSVEVAVANVEAQKANMGRISQTLGFSRVTAPFAGTINTRNIERGTLVSGTTPLFKLSQTDIVRVFIQMPQDVAPSVKIDAPAQVTVREFAGRTFDGKVARTAAALDNTSRTMQTEIRVPNEKHELLAGMYAQISVTLPSPHRVWELPATAVVTDAGGTRVAIVENGKIRMAKVSIERDNGATMDISSGIQDSDKLVKLATSELFDGRPVDTVPDTAPATSASAKK